jgi:hypothetical protein
MVRTQIQLTEEQSRRLKMLAADEKISIAELIRRSVDSYLGMQKQLDQNERRRRALTVAGKYSSGSSDGSVEHDRYLTEIYGENA